MTRQAGLRLAIMALLAVLAIGLRALGFTRGDVSLTPGGEISFHTFHPDEATLLSAAQGLQTPLDPPLTAYGLLPVYLARAALEIGAPGSPGSAGLQSDPRRDVLTARTLAILMSLATWLALIAFAWRRLGPDVGVAAGALAAAPPLVLQMAHFYTVDGVFALLFLLVLWATVEALRQPCWRRYLLVGLLVGLAGSVRLNGLSLGLLLLAGHLGRDGLGSVGAVGRRLVARDLWLAGAAALVVVLALQPYMLVHPQRMMQMRTTDDFAFSVAVARGEILRPWTVADVDTVPYLHYWTDLWPQSAGWPLTLLFAAATVWAAWRGGRLRWVLLGGCALIFLPVGGLHTKHVRYLLPLVAPLSLLAADLLHAGWNDVRRSRRLAAVVAGCGVLGASLTYGVAFARIYAQEDARLTAARWLRVEVPAGASIATEGGGFSMGGLIDSEYHVEKKLSTTLALVNRDYLTCQGMARYLAVQLQEVDWLALVDVNRYRQYTAAPRIVPGLADGYSRLFAGQLGFEPAARFKVYPRLAGLEWDDDAAEVSFLGYDHPAVHVLRQGQDARTILRAWADQISAESSCPDRYLIPLAAEIAAERPEAALALAADIPEDAAPGLQALLRSRCHSLLGDPVAEQEELDRFSAGFDDVATSEHLIPWATACSLIPLGLPDLARGVLRFGARHKDAFIERTAMMLSYVYVGDLFREYRNFAGADEAFRLAVQIDAKPVSLNRAAETAAARGDVREARSLWRQSLQLDASQDEVRQRLDSAGPEMPESPSGSR